MGELALQSGLLSPVVAIDQAVTRFQAFVEFTKRILREGVDYGKVPGTGEKPTLLKPGAEKLAAFFGLRPHYEETEKVLDWTGDQHGGQALFYFEYRCVLTRDGVVVGEGIGNCSSWEKKYRYRRAERRCPQCNAAAVIASRAEYGGGWVCLTKRGGCGEKWPAGAVEIENQPMGYVLNDNPADVVNTVSKLAQKRSLVAAVLVATCASEAYTQDLEDYVEAVAEPAAVIPTAVITESAPSPSWSGPNGSEAAAQAEKYLQQLRRGKLAAYQAVTRYVQRIGEQFSVDRARYWLMQTAEQHRFSPIWDGKQIEGLTPEQWVAVKEALDATNEPVQAPSPARAETPEPPGRNNDSGGPESDPNTDRLEELLEAWRSLDLLTRKHGRPKSREKLMLELKEWIMRTCHTTPSLLTETGLADALGRLKADLIARTTPPATVEASA